MEAEVAPRLRALCVSVFQPSLQKRGSVRAFNHGISKSVVVAGNQAGLGRVDGTFQEQPS